MFAAAGARSVGRNDLQSPESSPRSSPDPELTELLRSRATEFTFTTRDVEAEDARDDDAENEEEVELVLFAGAANETQSHKIRLSSPDAGTGEPGFLVKKPRSYYFADELSTQKEEEYKAAAITVNDLLAMSKIPWTGCAVPWKVRTIKPAGLQKVVLLRHPPALIEMEEPNQAPKKTRKGKKSRIAIRKKVQARKDQQAEQLRLAQVKEETEREKRTRRNREKKVKRKAREKAKKEGAADEDATLLSLTSPTAASPPTSPISTA